MKRNTIITTALLGVIAPVTFLVAHQDDPKIKDRQPAVKATAFRSAQSSHSARSLGFDAENVELMSWLPLSEFSSNSDNGNDCWGYVSPSGREYALMGTYDGTGVVEITNPRY